MLMTEPMAPAERTRNTGPGEWSVGEQGPRWADSCSLWFAAQPSACPLARRYLAWMLGEWELGGLISTAGLLASELLANAVTAAREDMAGPGQPVQIQFRVGRAAASLMLEVWDPSPEPPEARRADQMDEGGRGLHLLAALSTAWGFYRPRPGGKVVWCQIALDDAEARAW
jgi:hypothetical protein